MGGCREDEIKEHINQMRKKGYIIENNSPLIINRKKIATNVLHPEGNKIY